MSKKTKIKFDEEIALFYQAMKDVVPLAKKKVRVPLISTPILILNKKKSYHHFSKELDIEFYDKLYLEPVGSEDIISYKQPSLSNKIFKQLQKSQFPIEAMIDLHGLIVEEAMLAINNFIHQCVEEKIKTVLIIHGKGHRNNVPVLKNKINQWLRESSIILAFCSAKPAHGGCGAVYVLLSKD